MKAERLRKTAASLREEAGNLRFVADLESDAAIKRELEARANLLAELADDIERLDYVRSIKSDADQTPR